MTNSQRIITIVASVCSVLLAVAVVIAWKSPSTGYEASIYWSTPHLFWVFLLLVFIGGVSIVVHQVYTKGYEKQRLWMLGLLLLILGNGIMLALPATRGYALYGRGDPCYHLGWIQDIVSTGHFPKDLFYPVLHVYSAEFSSILEINPTWLHKYLPAFFGIFYIIGVYLFASSLLPHKGQVILTTLAATTLQVPTPYFIPDNICNLFLPFALFILVRSNIGTESKAQYTLLFILMIFLLAPFHPIPAGIFLLIMLTLPVARGLLAPGTHFIGGRSFKFDAAASVLTFVWIVTWISSFYIWGSAVRNIYRLAAEGGATHLEVLIGQIEYASRYGYSVAEQFFKAYGGTLLYVVLTLVSLPVLQRKLAKEAGYMRLVPLYCALVAVAVALLVLYFLQLEFSPTRLVRYVVMLCTPFVGFVLYELLTKARQQHANWVESRKWASRILVKSCLCTVVLIVTLTSVTGGLYMYRSPYRLEANDQTTRQDIEGTAWFLKYKDRDTITSGFFAFLPFRYAAFLLTPEERKGRHDIPASAPKVEPPYHFGYDAHQTLGESYPEDAYLAITQLDKATYSEVYPKMASIRFEPQDFEKLEHDPTLDRLYSNGEFEIWWVHASGASP